MIIVEVVPYKTFKEKLQLMKKLRRCRIESYPTYLYIERMVSDDN